MIFSYYDNYFTDDIIPEKYDRRSVGTGTNMINRHNSPGVMKDDYLKSVTGKEPKYVSAQEYYNYLLEYEDISFHAKLILFANNVKRMYKFNDNDNPCSSSMSDIMYVAHCYLYYERGFTPFENFSRKVIEDDNEENIKKFIREEIDKGFPVYTSIEDAKGEGHAVVAYAYDSSGEIYFHTGWHGYGTRQTVTSISYKKIYRAAAVEFYIKADEHKHTDNYEITGVEESRYYCYCSDEIVTYKHAEHNYTCKYVNIDADTHKAYCICEDYKIQNHAYNERCKSVSAEKHYAYCKCGVGGEFEHLWKIYSDPSLSPGRYVKCRNCGFIKKLTDENVNVTLSVRKEEYL